MIPLFITGVICTHLRIQLQTTLTLLIRDLAQNSGACAQNSPVYLASDNLRSELGSDYYNGGGFVEEVLLSWEPTTAGTATAATVTFTPDRTMKEGDSIQIPLGLPGIVADVEGGTSTCTPTGQSASLFLVNVTVATSTIILTVADGEKVIRGAPVTLTIPTECKIFNPSITPAENDYFTATGTIDLSEAATELGDVTIDNATISNVTIDNATIENPVFTGTFTIGEGVGDNATMSVSVPR
jgi:hypothetical protein